MTITLSSVRTTFTRSLTAGLLTAAATIGLAAAPKAAQAQEIQLTGPLAGAPAVRDLRQYRKGRFEVAPVVAFTLLDEYQRTTLVGGRLQYNFTDWFALGVWGAFGSERLDGPDRPDQRERGAQHPHGGQRVDRHLRRPDGEVEVDGHAAGGVHAVPRQARPLQLDLRRHRRVSSTPAWPSSGLEERGDCGGGGGQEVSCTDARELRRFTSRVAVAPSFGIGLNFYLTSFMSLGAEYRALPFSWNRAGFDTPRRGERPELPGQQGRRGGPDLQVQPDDRHLAGLLVPDETQDFTVT